MDDDYDYQRYKKLFRQKQKAGKYIRKMFLYQNPEQWRHKLKL